jgi:heme exporter protein B
MDLALSAPQRLSTPDSSTRTALGAMAALLVRELQLALRRPASVLTPLAFFALVGTLFPLSLSAEAARLREWAPGVCMVAALLALPRLWADDAADGSLELMVLAPAPLLGLVGAKLFAHWLLTGLPLLLAAPLLTALYGLPGGAMPTLLAALLLTTPVLTLLGGMGAALTLNARGGSLLLALLLLPLQVPVLVFASAAVQAAAQGQSPAVPLQLLGTLLSTTLVLCPWATTAALRLNLE